MQTETEDTTVEQATNESLDQDTLHELLSNSRRRAILELLDEHGELDKSDLAEMVASREYNKEVDQLTSKQRKRVYISLSQQHEPSLEEARVIESNGTIQLTERADELLWHLEGKPEESPCDQARSFVRSLF